jgi:hypothetical protein
MYSRTRPWISLGNTYHLCLCPKPLSHIRTEKMQVVSGTIPAMYPRHLYLLYIVLSGCSLDHCSRRDSPLLAPGAVLPPTSLPAYLLHLMCMEAQMPRWREANEWPCSHDWSVHAPWQAYRERLDNTFDRERSVDALPRFIT